MYRITTDEHRALEKLKGALPAAALLLPDKRKAIIALRVRVLTTLSVGAWMSRDFTLVFEAVRELQALCEVRGNVRQSDGDRQGARPYLDLATTLANISFDLGAYTDLSGVAPRQHLWEY